MCEADRPQSQALEQGHVSPSLGATGAYVAQPWMVRLTGPATYWLLGLTISYLAAAFCWLFILVSPSADPEQPFLNELIAVTPPPSFLESLERSDVIHFLHVAQSGYSPGDDAVAFHPLYPLLVRLLSLGLFGDVSSRHALISGLLISGACALLVAILLGHLCREYLSDAGCHLCLLLWVLNPTAVFLSAAYTEPLYLALVLGAFVRAGKQDWWSAGALTGLACLTRPVGVIAYAAILVRCWESRWAHKMRPPRASLGLALPAVAICGYVVYQSIALGDPLAVWHAEQRRWNQHLIVPSSFPDYISMTLSAQSLLRPDHGALICFNLVLLGLAIAVTGRLSGSRRFPACLKVYTILTLLSILCRGSDMSIARLLMAAFPLHMTLADWLTAGPAARAFLIVLLFLVLDVMGTIAFVANKAFF